MLEIRYYVAANGDEPFAEWFAELEAAARAKVARAVARMEQGNFSNVKSVGGGVLEFRIDFGPGYRIYFGRDGEAVIILLTGVRRDGNSAISMPLTPTGKTTSRAGAGSVKWRPVVAKTKSFRELVQ